MSKRSVCSICLRRCSLLPGEVGACRARANNDGEVACVAYGHLTAMALDPIEKKPIARWHEGSTVLSVGAFGCNLSCPFCQNHDIAQVGQGQVPTRYVAPEELVAQAKALEAQGCIGLAFTYNEPFVTYEYMRDCALLAHEEGLLNVAVTNGMVQPGIFGEALGFLDAVNIDLKGFTNVFYRACGFDGLEVVKSSIAAAAACPTCHLEVTTLVVPTLSDASQVEEAAQWLAGIDPNIPYHVTQYHPAYRYLDRPPLPNSEVCKYAHQARAHLTDVIEGNMR